MSTSFNTPAVSPPRPRLEHAEHDADLAASPPFARGRGSSPYEDFTFEQQYVANTINRLGGYWPPAAAVMRLLEEFGEASLALEGVGDLGEELADIKIISTCLANQFKIGLRQPSTLRAVAAGRAPSLGQLVQNAGRIARIVNYYDGPKAPRPTQQLEHLGSPILDLHRGLQLLAEEHGLDLAVEVARKLEHTLARDGQRFSVTFDPATSDVLAAFAPTIESTACTFARAAKLWGGPRWNADRNVGYNCEITVPYLTRFARAAIAEGLDGFIISPVVRRKPHTVAEVGDVLRETLQSLSTLDPDGNGAPSRVFATPGWQFTYAGQRLFVTVFSDVYSPDHVRHSPRGTYFMLQPEESFSHHGIGGSHKDSDKIKTKVRENFASRGMSYPHDLIASRIEAHLYLLPETGEEPVVWWDPTRDPDQSTLW
ncbi:YqcI/YcgG family protein [Nocardioides lacusdianchii]|uniref:YqcI/YcgG family protein n=1 Tax=Nocardioides lacusdianchii TaxID=2783664 RepID=UPI001CCB19F5|nr:YqcI/YcgG family protein [Nocardioides lacusdianchii]